MIAYVIRLMLSGLILIGCYGVSHEIITRSYHIHDDLYENIIKIHKQLTYLRLELVS